MPQASYQIKIFSPSTGSQVAVLTPTEIRSMYLERTLNSYDTLTLSIDEDNANIQYFELDTIMEIWRKIGRAGAEWYLESTLFHRTSQHDFTEGQRRIFISYSRGLLDLLHRRYIEYPANTAFTLKSGPGESVMKEFVDENAGPGAASVLRKSYGTWTAPFPGFTVSGDSGLGTEWSGSAAWKNLLETVAEVSQETGVDFDVVRTGPLTFEFRTYYPQYGVDRSSDLLFTPRFGNMTDIIFIKSRTEEANAVLVLGQGEESARRIYAKVDPARIDSPWNTIEVVRDARGSSSVNALITEANEAINDLRAQDEFTFKVLQTSSRQYGQNAEYWLGDLVQAKYESYSVVRKIVGATLNLNEGREEVGIKFSQFPTRRT